jgi:hypothetical protein
MDTNLKAWEEVLKTASYLYSSNVENAFIGSGGDAIASSHRGRSIVLLAIEIMKGEK